MERAYLVVILVLLGTGRIYSSYRQLLDDLKSELNFEYVVLLGKSDPIWQKLLWQMSVPLIQMDEEPETEFVLGGHHSHNFLTIAFLDESVDDSLKFLYLTLNLLNTRPVLLVIKYSNIRIYSILEWCWQHQLLNVLAIEPHFEVRFCS